MNNNQSVQVGQTVPFETPKKKKYVIFFTDVLKHVEKLISQFSNGSCIIRKSPEAWSKKRPIVIYNLPLWFPKCHCVLHFRPIINAHGFVACPYDFLPFPGEVNVAVFSVLLLCFAVWRCAFGFAVAIAVVISYLSFVFCTSGSL